MTLDPSTISSILIAAAALLGWLYTQTTAKARAERKEMRWRRKRDGYIDVWIARIRIKAEANGWELPPAPKELAQMEHEQEEKGEWW